VPNVPRVLVTLLVAALALAAPLTSGASGDGASKATSVTAAAASKIVLRGRQGIEGPWRRSLRLKLFKGGLPTQFVLCAVWDQSVLFPTCRAARGNALPQGTILRLEQHRPRNVGWKRVGQSPEAALEAVLSNDLSGNQPGEVLYRVTLRKYPAGDILAMSNSFKVVWKLQ
jgi:hypothetical protein